MAAAFIALAPLPGWAVGSWQKISNFPYSNPGHMLLLTDGTVMVQDFGQVEWYTLKPDSQGHYLNGNWSTINNMIDSRYYYASQVLQSGKVLIAGGEFGDSASGRAAEIYDPVANSWTATPLAGVGFADSESILLANGTVLTGPVGFYNGNGSNTFIYNPTANQWSVGPMDLSYQDESTWLKLPDGSILSVDIFTGGTTSERYIPSANATMWIEDAGLPIPMEGGNTEVGGAFMLDDGRAFWLGGAGHTAFYTPSGNTNNGAWKQGPDMPFYNGTVLIAQGGGKYASTNYTGLLSAQDTPAAMMNNGKILCQLAANTFHSETWFYEYNPSTSNFVAAPSPTNSTAGASFLPASTLCDATSMLDLPDGTVLYTDEGSLYLYTPDGTPLTAGKPTINNISYNIDGSLHLTGTLFNGISQGASYGDDAQQDSNYPLVRFIDGSGNVTYGKTFNWSSTGVQTGSQIVSAECTVPTAILDSPASYFIEVVANGNASSAVSYRSPVWVDFNYTGSTINGSFANPYKTLAEGTNAVASGGTIAINASSTSDSHETLTINKAMTIVSVYGPSTIGR